jgi:hypothetical protein
MQQFKDVIFTDIEKKLRFMLSQSGIKSDSNLMRTVETISQEITLLRERLDQSIKPLNEAFGTVIPGSPAINKLLALNDGMGITSEIIKELRNESVDRWFEVTKKQLLELGDISSTAWKILSALKALNMTVEEFKNLTLVS